MFKMKKTLITLVSLLAVLCVTVGGTLAYLATTSGPVTNTFNSTSVTTKVNEEFKNNKKTDVTIQNTGSTDAYIRAAVVVTWQDKDGNVYGTQPVSGDYSMQIGSGWTKGSDGFYYWKGSVAPGKSTGELIEECTYIKGAPAGYSLSVEIMGSGIQSKGKDAAGKTPVELAWGNDAAKAVGAK